MNSQKILLKYESKKENLLQAVKEINRVNGWVSQEAVDKIARYFNLKPAAVYSAASFYDEIKTEKPALVLIEVCDGASCQTRNAEKLISYLENYFKQKFDDVAGERLELKRISCQSRCLEGPVMKINGTVFSKMDSGKAVSIIENYLK